MREAMGSKFPNAAAIHPGSEFRLSIPLSHDCSQGDHNLPSKESQTARAADSHPDRKSSRLNSSHFLFTTLFRSFILAQNSGFQSHCLTIVHRAITTYLQKKAKRHGLRTPIQPGAVTLIQRFGGPLNLHVPYH